jgi:hypothetical protein
MVFEPVVIIGIADIPDDPLRFSDLVQDILFRPRNNDAIDLHFLKYNTVISLVEWNFLAIQYLLAQRE